MIGLCPNHLQLTCVGYPTIQDRVTRTRFGGISTPIARVAGASITEAAVVIPIVSPPRSSVSAGAEKMVGLVSGRILAAGATLPI